METEPWASPPLGFEVKHVAKELVLVEYRVTKLKPMHWFLILWLSFWTIGCVTLVFGRVQTAEWWFKAIFCGTDLLVAAFVAYLLFERRLFQVSPTELKVEIECFSWKRSISIPREGIHQLRQVITGGEGEDSFPTWGIEVVGTQH